MRVFREQEVPMRPGDPRTFSGPVFAKLFASADEGTPVTVYRVEFQDGGRTNWHSHSGPQWLFVVEGVVRIQCRGEAPIDVHAGDVIQIAPGEKHWHGAAPGSHAVHLAVNVNLQTTWFEPVTLDTYLGRA